jgi:predicted Zn-dependent peptidase
MSLFLKMKRIILGNGLKLILEKRPKIKTASITVGVKVGSIFESDHDNGISHLTEHMLFRNKFKGLIEELHSYGGSFYDPYTNHTHTIYSLNILHNFTDKGVGILFDVLTNPKFDRKSFEIEKNVVLEEVRYQTFSEPFLLAYRLFEKNLDKRLLPTIGNEKSVKNISLDELYSFYRKYYVPNNMVISVVGNIEYKSIEEGIKNTFGNLKSKELSLPSYKIEKVKDSRTIEIEDKGLKQAYILLGKNAPGKEDRRSSAMEVLMAILGKTMNSRLYMKFVEGTGIARYVGAEYDKIKGCYVVYLTISTKNTSSVRDALLEEMKNLRENGITQKELENAKNFLKGYNAVSNERNQNLAEKYVISELFGKAEETDMYDEKIDSVTMKDVKDVIGEFLSEGFMLIMKPGV